MFTNYHFYTNSYLCGKPAVIPSACFDFYARKAAQEIKRFTLNNIDEDNLPECVELCCCEIAELLYNSEQRSETEGISSESVGDHSVHYEDAKTARQLLGEKIEDSVIAWLSGTGFLFRGVR